MTTLWNITTKQQLTIVLEQAKSAVTALAEATPMPTDVPAAPTPTQRAVYGDIVACEARLATLLVTIEELISMLPAHDGLRKAS